MSNVKGSNLSVGQLVTLNISNKDKVNTVIVGPITGIQEWDRETIAIQIAGIDTWIILRDDVELGVV
jgi:hypothetical protein